jgi:hypothetical protein
MRSEPGGDAFRLGQLPYLFQTWNPERKHWAEDKSVMYRSDHLTNRSQLVGDSIKRPAQCRGLYLSVLSIVAAWLALSRDAGAVCEQGCGNNGNTFLGESGLSNTTTGAFNTAIGYAALFNNTEGSNNTASGESALTTW